MVVSLPTPEKDPAYRWGAAALFIAAAIILAALGFEYIGGYRPCPLCLQQRYAYYAGIPILFGALVLTSTGQKRLAGALFALVALGFRANTGLAIYHAGVEWKWWEGPQTCQMGLEPLTSGTGSLLERLQTTRVIRCDEAAWRFLGLSFAGWNAVFSLLLAIATFSAARLSLQRD